MSIQKRCIFEHSFKENERGNPLKKTDMEKVTELNQANQENLIALLSNVNASHDGGRKAKISDVVGYECMYNYDVIEVTDVVIATMISFVARKTQANGGINNGLQLGWITKTSRGTYTITCYC